MSAEFKKFAIKLVMVALVVLVVGAIIFRFFFTGYYQPVYLWSLAFFFVVTLFVHAYQLKLAKTNVAKFTRISMVMTFIKLLIYSVFTVVSLAINTQNAIAFVIVIMTLYIVFTVTEVTDLMRVARTSKKEE